MRVSAIAAFLTLAAFLLFSTAGVASAETLTDISDSFERLVKKVNPSVVQIFSTGYGFFDGIIDVGFHFLIDALLFPGGENQRCFIDPFV